MATLDDKILGEKKHYYCSSSEDEDQDSDKETEETAAEPQPPPPTPGKWEGSSKNTGPKGVIKDWQRYKQLESEKRKEQELERLELAKRLCLTCEPTPNDQDPDLLEIDDGFIEQFRKQRMEEMLRAAAAPKFNSVFHLANGSEFLDAIDNEDKTTMIIVHIYEESDRACRTMNTCLNKLAKQYPTVKFCRMVGSTAGMSYKFKVEGVPALLVYKSGSVVDTFIRVTDSLGDEFYDGDVENFLIEKGILSDRFAVPQLEQDEENSDCSIE